MITFQFPENTKPKVHFASSPLLETSTSFCLFTHDCLPIDPVLQRWQREAREALHGVTFPYLSGVTQKHYTVDFITPTPTDALVDFETELQLLQDTPTEVIIRDIETLIHYSGESEFTQQFLTYPRESLDCLIEELRLYWQRAVAPYWARAMAVIEGDVLYRAKRQFLGGINSVFEDTHPLLSYSRGQIALKKNWLNYEIALDDSGITLVPLFFADMKIFFQPTTQHYRPMIAFGAWGRSRSRDTITLDERPLDTLIGETRASLLEHLNRPTSTGELAMRLGVTSGAVSQHLAKLSQSGLVEAERSGQRVFYRLTERGEHLLSLFGL